ncbi:MAG: type sorting protein, partial [Chitinophagaceae bacterium]|nr:type sorting protein [Chitinophagaceae bacterium]
MKSRIAVLILVFFSTYNLTAQSLYEVSLSEKTSHSTLIVEGKVIDQRSFWNSNHTMIYTSNKVEVYKVFKGSLSQSILEIVTVGGRVENDGLEISEALKLSKNQVGTFFLYPNSINIKSPTSFQRLWDVYSSSQGFIRYDLNKETASAPFVRYKSISGDFYKDIKTKTNRNFENKKPSFSVSALNNKNTRELTALAPVISSFSPAMVNAGALLDPVNNVLTINGSGFGTGAASAAVLFDDADDGAGGTAFPVAYNDPLVILWSDTQ